MIDLMGPAWMVHVPQQTLEWKILAIQYLVLILLNQSIFRLVQSRRIFWEIHDGAHQFSSPYYLTISPVIAISRLADTKHILIEGL